MSTFSQHAFFHAMLLLATSPCVEGTGVSIVDSHLPANEADSFKRFAAAREETPSTSAQQPPLQRLSGLFGKLAKLLSDEPALAAPLQSDNETASRNGSQHFTSLSGVARLTQARDAASDLLASMAIGTYDFTPATDTEVREVRYLYQLVRDHAAEHNLYTKMSDGEIDFLQKIEEALRVQRSHDDEVDLAAPEEIQFLTSRLKNFSEVYFAYINESKREILTFQDCDDDNKNSSEWCSPDGDNTNALTQTRNKLKGLLVQALGSIQTAETANILQQTLVTKARAGVEASQQSPNTTLEWLSAKMESFQYAIGTSTLKLTEEKAAVVQTSLGLLDGMKQISLNVDASASAARDEAQKLLDGDWHMSVENTLRDCFKQLAEQAKYVQDRTTAVHNMNGFEAAKVKHFDQTELVQSRQNIATEFVKNAIVSLINVRSYLSKAKEMLVERLDQYKDTIFKRHTAILIQKEKIFRDLYSWYHTNIYEPAEMDLVFANGELAQAKTNKVLYCYAPNTRCDTAKAALKAKRIEKGASEARVTTATEARDAVLNGSLNDTGYDDVRKELETRGVQLCYRGSSGECLEAHATEVQPDNVKKVKGAYGKMIAALGGILSLY